MSVSQSSLTLCTDTRVDSSVLSQTFIMTTQPQVNFGPFIFTLFKTNPIFIFKFEFYYTKNYMDTK